MKKIEIDLENCYGINKLKKEFDFTDSNVYSIYAPNGMMKTSFLKTFRQLQKGKKPLDGIFGKESKYDIKIDNKKITKANREAIFTIESLDSSFESDKIHTLLLNDEIKEKVSTFETDKNTFLNNISEDSGIRLSQKSRITGKTEFILEGNLNKIFEVKSFIDLISKELLKEESINIDVTYSDLFSSTLEKLIISSEFQNEIGNYLSKIDDIYKKNSFLKSGEFTLGRLEEIYTSLVNNNFFDTGYTLNIESFGDKITKDDIKEKIELIKSEITGISDEFEKLLKGLESGKGMQLLELIQNKPDLVEELKKENIEEFKRKIFIGYFIKNAVLFEKVIDSYFYFTQEIDQISEKDEKTKWENIVEEFKGRFYVPFTPKVINLDKCILGVELPSIVFQFCENNSRHKCTVSCKIINLTREELDGKHILSQGEKRALYLLNIMFEIEAKNKDKNEYLLIIDDIADSFDYKNKYAIIQYLKELSEEVVNIGTEIKPELVKKYKIILLTHNFDFYRTIQSRLLIQKNSDIKLTKNLIANKNKNGIYLDNGTGLLNSIVEMFNGCNSLEKVFTLLPAIRNITEYTINSPNYSKKNTDNYNILTGMLHKKIDEYNLGNLIDIYDDYIKIDITLTEEDNDKTINIIKKMCDSIIVLDTLNLERKIVLSIGIRLEAEKFMFKKVGQKEYEGNQTWQLYKECNSKLTKKEDNIIKDVFLMTPENIHFNSFMYEPILDMGDWHLIELYKDLLELNKPNNGHEV